jgi:hypothetical protein
MSASSEAASPDHAARSDIKGCSDVSESAAMRFVEASPPLVRDNILKLYYEVCYSLWLKRSSAAGLLDVLYEIRGLRTGDCTHYSEYGQVISWNDRDSDAADTFWICGCREGMDGFDSTYFSTPCVYAHEPASDCFEQDNDAVAPAPNLCCM